MIPEVVKMKKSLACLFIISCMVALLSFPVSAANAKNVDVIIDPKESEVTVSINTDFACGALQGVVTYNSEATTYQAIDVADSISEKNQPTSTVSDKSGQTKVALVGDVSNGTQGEWAKVTYKADENAPAMFDFKSLKVYDKEGNKIEDANLYVVMYGDANIDGLVNIKDLVAMKKISAGNTSILEHRQKNLDMDKSGKWEDALDITALRKYLLGVF